MFNIFHLSICIENVYLSHHFYYLRELPHYKQLKTLTTNQGRLSNAHNLSFHYGYGPFAHYFITAKIAIMFCVKRKVVLSTLPNPASSHYLLVMDVVRSANFWLSWFRGAFCTVHVLIRFVGLANWYVFVWVRGGCDGLLLVIFKF